MAPDEPRKGLWGRVKGALGVPEEEDDLTSRPQVTSSFTASRLPSGDGGPIQSRLFPKSGSKWDLYEDAWGEIGTAQEPDAVGADAPDLDSDADTDLDVPDPDAAAADWPPTEPDDEWLIPEAPWASSLDVAPAGEDIPPKDLSATLEALAGADDDADDVLAHLDTDEVAALARAVGYDEADPEPFAVASPQADAEPVGLDVIESEPVSPPAPATPDDMSRPVPAAATVRPPAPGAHTPAAVGPAPVTPAWQPTPDIAAVQPNAEGGMFSAAPSEVRDRLLSATAGSTSIAPRDTTPALLQRGPDADDESGQHPQDIGAQRKIAVHEARLEAAISRARQASPPRAKVHDDRLEEPAPPQALNPSEALALAERGRGAIGPRSDVAPAS